MPFKMATLPVFVPNLFFKRYGMIIMFQELMDKQLTAQQAFMKGKLKVKGNMGLAMKLTTVIGAAQKYLPKSKL